MTVNFKFMLSLYFFIKEKNHKGLIEELISIKISFFNHKRTKFLKKKCQWQEKNASLKETDEGNIFMGERGTFYDGKALFQNDKLITCQRSKEFGS